VRTETKSRYYKFSDYLRKRYGCRVWKVSVDAGFSCPNRDGTINTGGCIFCNNAGFSYNTSKQIRSIDVQISEGIEYAKKRFSAEKFIVYFQAHTNTYAPITQLREKYDIARKYPEVVSLSIGTRPDCVNENILDLISEYSDTYEVWMEYGLQTIHDITLNRINRGHNYESFLRAVEQTRKRKGLKICAHVIVGLPGEKEDDIMSTAKEVARLKLDGIKIHPLHIMKGSLMETMHEKEPYALMDQETYAHLAVSFLEYLWPQTVIQRITADCSEKYLVGPAWIREKNAVLKQIALELEKRDSFQGRLYQN